MKLRAVVVGAIASLAVAGLASPAEAASYGNVRNGGMTPFWVDSTYVPAGSSSLESGDSDANTLYVPSGSYAHIWRIAAASSGSKYWEWVGTFRRDVPLGNTSYIAKVYRG